MELQQALFPSLQENESPELNKCSRNQKHVTKFYQKLFQNSANFAFQLFVHCWVDESRDRSTIHVIASASVPGTHIAAQVQPLDGGERVDLSVFSFFVPPENAINTRSGHAFVAHSRQQVRGKHVDKVQTRSA